MMTLETTTSLDKKDRKDLRVLVTFTAVYCRHHHDAETDGVDIGSESCEPLATGQYQVCAECREFLSYAIARRINCPLDPKPVCKHCPVHCYKPDYRQQVKDIMRFSGKYLLLRGRLDLLWHYFF